ncbi:MAG TPA: radical SAM protein [Bacillota bacterium]|nr:radical SAM protein [Bacillota bacterium]
MQTRGFDSNKGTIKKPKQLKGRYCLQPFTNVDIHSNYGVRCCSESWMPSWVGDFSQNSIEEIWNSQAIQDIRQSILDGTYQYCDWHQCPFYCNDQYYLYSREDLENPGRLPELHRNRILKYAPWIKYILESKTKLDIMPANYNLAYDETCNLKCPSCRSTTKVYTQGPEYELRLAIQQKLLQEVDVKGFDNIGRFNLTGAGEPFISKIFKDFLFNFEGKKHPKLDINIQSNGVLFTPEVWDNMKKIHDNINEVIISLDASCAETYEKIRVNGNFEVLLQNIEFLAKLRSENKIKRLMLAYVVQQKNYREMIDAIKIAQKYQVDLFIFNLLNDWMSWTKEEYEKNAIWKLYHPEYPDFIKILTDPIFDDPMIDLGNMTEYRMMARLKTVEKDA